MATTREILIRAREIIARPGAWLQGHLATNSFGDVRCPTADNRDTLTCFCALGAVDAACIDLTGSGGGTCAADLTLSRALSALDAAFVGNVPAFNDAEGRTQEEVVALFDRAIKMTKE